MHKILIVEDEEAMAVGLRDGFAFEGYEVLWAKDGPTGLNMAKNKSVDLVILDVMLPKMSGFDVCKEIRKSGLTPPIIMLTARGQETDKVVGLKLGADDYVTKPFGFMELLARVEAVLRRSKKNTPSADLGYSFGDVVVDQKNREVSKRGVPLLLSSREFRLLLYFLEHRGKVIERDTLLDAVWGVDRAVFTRTVDMHVAKLRKKLEDDPANPQYIITVHGIGYKFAGP